MVFDNRKKSVLFYDKEKGFLTIEKSDLFFICFKRMKKIFFLLFFFNKKREFHP